MMNRQDDNTVDSLNGFRAEGFCQQNLFHLAAIDSDPEQTHVINYFAYLKIFFTLSLEYNTLLCLQSRA